MPPKRRVQVPSPEAIFEQLPPAWQETILQRQAEARERDQQAKRDQAPGRGRQAPPAQATPLVPTGTGRIVGYARVSGDDQELGFQLDALRAAGAAEVFTDKMSGSRDDRPGMRKAMAALQSGDTLAVWKLDRLGRSTFDLLKILRTLRDQGVAFRSLTEALDTSTAAGELIFTVLGAVASYERAIIRERIKAGIRSLKDRGGRTGRKPVLFGDRLKLAMRMLDEDGYSYPHVARVLGVGLSTLHGAAKRVRAAGEAPVRKPSRAKPGGMPRNAETISENQESRLA